MLTSVQREILQNLINLYQSKGNSIKGEDIAEVMNRNPGTIRNQMQSLRGLSLVKGVPGPRGGYKPTIEAYHALNIDVSEKDFNVPIYIGDKQIDDVTVAKIEFTSVPKPSSCEAAIKILGDIRNFSVGDEIRIGPTPVNNLGIIGTIVGSDDSYNTLLVETKTIRSIPKKTVGEIASKNIIFIKHDDNIKDVSKIFSENHIKGAPVIKNKEIMGMVSIFDILNAIALSNDDVLIEDLNLEPIVSIKQNTKIGEAINIMFSKNLTRIMILDEDKNFIGIVSLIDLLDTIINISELPIISIISD